MRSLALSDRESWEIPSQAMAGCKWKVMYLVDRQSHLVQMAKEGREEERGATDGGDGVGVIQNRGNLRGHTEHSSINLESIPSPACGPSPGQVPPVLPPRSRRVTLTQVSGSRTICRHKKSNFFHGG